MKAEKIPIVSTKLIELNYDLTKNRIRIPTNLKNAVVRVNFKVFKSDKSRLKIENILDKIRKQEPQIVFPGNIKVIAEQSRGNKKLPIQASRRKLVEIFILKFAPPVKREMYLDEAFLVFEEVNEEGC